jgi:hypothetical protein
MSRLLFVGEADAACGGSTASDTSNDDFEKAMEDFITTKLQKTAEIEGKYKCQIDKFRAEYT